MNQSLFSYLYNHLQLIIPSLDVSYIYTIRQAMELLVADGYINKRKGSGSYVSYEFLNSETNHNAKKIGLIVTYLSDYIFPSIIFILRINR